MMGLFLLQISRINANVFCAYLRLFAKFAAKNVALMLLVFPALAIDSIAPRDPVLLERYKDLTEELRCLVCQNQNLADSNATLAVDLRVQIREQLEAGKSNDEILDFMVQRYGDFVLYRPPWRASTVLLWMAPLLLLLIALTVALRAISRQHKHAAAGTLDTDEQHKLNRLLDDKDPQ